jgi:hypothetical protein
MTMPMVMVMVMVMVVMVMVIMVMCVQCLALPWVPLLLSGLASLVPLRPQVGVAQGAHT